MEVGLGVNGVILDIEIIAGAVAFGTWRENSDWNILGWFIR